MVLEQFTFYYFIHRGKTPSFCPCRRYKCIPYNQGMLAMTAKESRTDPGDWIKGDKSTLKRTGWSWTSQIPKWGEEINVAESTYNCFQCVSPSPHIRSGSSPCLCTLNCCTHYWLQLHECIQNLLLTQINFSEQKFSKNPSSQTPKNKDVEKYLQDAFRKAYTLSFGLLWLQNASYIFHIFTNPTASLLHVQFGCVICMPYVSNLGKKTTLKKYIVNGEIIS